MKRARLARGFVEPLHRLIGLAHAGVDRCDRHGLDKSGPAQLQEFV
jgi:hypothetical protein